MRRVPIPKLHRRKLPSGAVQWFTWTRGQFVALGPDEQEARQRLARLVLGEDSDDGNDDELTIVDLAARYWRHLERKHGNEKLAQRAEVDRLAQKPLLKLFGASRAREFGPRDLRRDALAGQPLRFELHVQRKFLAQSLVVAAASPGRDEPGPQGADRGHG